MSYLTRILIFLGTILTILLLTHFFVYKTSVKFLAITRENHLLVTKLLFFILPLIFIVVSMLSQWYFNPLTVFLYRISAVWIGLFMWLFLSSVILWIIFGISRMFNVNLNMQVITSILAFFCLVLNIYGVVNSFHPRITEVTVKLPNLPADWKGKKVAFVADTHFGQIRTSGQARKISKLIESTKPELVLIAGDFYDGPKTDFVGPAKIFGDIHSKYGTYFVTGNHEEYTNGHAYLNGIKNSRIVDIDDRIVTINGLQLLGLAYESNHSAEQVKANLEKFTIDNDKPSILIKHVPLHVDVAAKAGVSLQLYGHSHNGQMFPNNLIAKWVFRGYNYGLKPAGSSMVYTTSGVGTWGPPQRIGTKPEVVLITLE